MPLILGIVVLVALVLGVTLFFYLLRADAAERYTKRRKR